MKRVRLFLVAAMFAVFAIAFAVSRPTPVLAHGHTEVGPYALTFGWQVEPAYVGVLNGPELTIVMHDDESQKVEGAETTLNLEVQFGGQTKTLKLQPAWNDPGHYVASLIPTRAGDYVFKLTGKIGDTDVDLTFDSAEGEFSSIEPLGDVLFPDTNADIASLQAQIDQLKAEIEKLKSN